MADPNVNIEKATKFQTIIDGLPPEAYDRGVPRRPFFMLDENDRPVGAYLSALQQAVTEAEREGIHRSEEHSLKVGLSLSGLSEKAINLVMAQAAEIDPTPQAA